MKLNDCPSLLNHLYYSKHKHPSHFLIQVVYIPSIVQSFAFELPVYFLYLSIRKVMHVSKIILRLNKYVWKSDKDGLKWRQMHVLVIAGSQANLLFFCQIPTNFQTLTRTVPPQRRRTHTIVKHQLGRATTTLQHCCHLISCNFLVSEGHVLSVGTFKL